MKAIFEKINDSPESQVTAFLFDDSDFNTPWHYHPQCELTCILESKGIRYVGNHIAAYEEYDLVLLGGNLPHYWKKTSIGGRARSMVLQWDEEIIPYIPDLQKMKSYLQEASRGIKFHRDEAEQILPMMEKIINGKNNPYIALLEILNHLSQVDSFELLAGASYKPDISQASQNRLDIILKYISAHYQQKITLTDMAELLHMTAPSFSRFFSHRFQKPFTAYLNEYRINRASRMLMESDVQVAKIGFECGYESLSFFYTQFKKYKKLSPLVYRKKYRLGI